MSVALQPIQESRPLPQVRLLGVRVHPVTMTEAVETVSGWIARGDRGRWIVASGMHALLEARRRPDFRRVLEQVDLFLPDGFSVVWMARRRGYRVPARVCGTDFLWALCGAAAARGHRVFFYGDAEPVLARLVERLRAAFPALQIAGTLGPPFRALTPAEEAADVARINASRADIVWVGLGLPKQERWIEAHRDRLEASVLVGIGAGIKFAAGAIPRAPGWLGERGLEWAWRLLHEPRRMWRRALDVPYFVALVLREEAQLAALRVVAAVGTTLKRGLDILLAGVGLVVSLPLWAVFAVLIKLEDGGQVFFRQERVGRWGRHFRSVKFRTMVPDADARCGPRQAAEDDPRITRVGRWLRATAMDELPQLWNILIGDMSVVGPRALAPGEIEVRGDGRYLTLADIVGSEFRQQVRPGLTGLAQVYAPRDVPRRQKFRYDRLYVLRRNIWLDVRLILLSFFVTLKGKWETRQQKVSRA